MPHPCHIVVANNPAIIYASRNGTPDRVLPILKPFLDTFWQERDLAGEDSETPACLVAQIIVRFGFELCEDDFSNLRVGVSYNPKAEYLYWISPQRDVSVWVTESRYRKEPTMGLEGCRRWEGEGDQRL
ncbi:histidine kinase [Stenomitos frigidus]|uniref:Histidine kinase n=1 Tax=Stenomitos frigidus ULC18 TaxID=2107698 RepID=A0A2T1E1F3_9CYAN|nr:histidine kinase [Stenomitos frigidus]PSB26585.1 histidine kinase [Stenomitos frigidus ULC18]